MTNQPISCPHCGSTTYYIKQYIHGYGYAFDDTTGKDVSNCGIHDGLHYEDVGKYAYCAECDNRFAKISKLYESKV